MFTVFMFVLLTERIGLAAIKKLAASHNFWLPKAAFFHSQAFQERRR